MSWPVRPLGEVADTALGKMLDKGKPRGHPHVPYLRNVNVQWGRIDTSDLLTMELADNERERFAVEPGDLLVCEGGEVGRCAIWRGRGDYLAYQKALHRVRPGKDLDVAFLRYLLEHKSQSGTLAGLTTGSTIAHLPQQQLRKLLVPLPAVSEQHRIVDVLETYLSHLESAHASLAISLTRLSGLRERSVVNALTAPAAPCRVRSTPLDVGVRDGDLPSLPVDWAWARLGEVADVVGGVTKDAKKQSDPTFVSVPYLRVANVQRGYLKLDHVAEIRVDQRKAVALRLIPGDVLLNEGGDRDKLARGWVWEGQVDHCIHQNHVFRARLHEPRLDPYFLSFTANTFGGPWAERNGKQSVNLASISLKTIKQMPVIVPSPGEAERVVASLREALASFDRLELSLRQAGAREAALRRALLTAAFSGRLTGSASDLSVAEEMLGP